MKFCFIQNAKRASLAAEPLAAWAKANVQYSYVLEKIEPLETEQNELKKFVIYFKFNKLL